MTGVQTCALPISLSPSLSLSLSQAARGPRLANCMQPPTLRMFAWAADSEMPWPETLTTSTGQWALWGRQSSLGPGISLSGTLPLA